ncbi:MAG: hypothetical protein AAB510_03280 [Patescibacteria group bacterium]
MKKRFLTLILITAFTSGFFSPVFNVQAQGSPETETSPLPPTTTTPTGAASSPTPDGSTKDTKTSLDESIGCANFFDGSPDKCLTRIIYTLFYVLPSGILWLVAQLFNASLAITLSSLLFDNDFLSEAWKIVRDISNIFFIIILLHVAFKTILGLGGSEVKKVISEVIIVALFINFSMFFTQVVIDSSNVLALVFYNKITVVTKNGEVVTKSEPITNTEKTGVEEKNFAGGIVSGFNPNNFINLDKFKETQGASWLTGAIIGAMTPIPGGAAVGGVVQQAVFGNSVGVPTSITLLLIFTAGAIFLIASYAFFIAAFAFLGRLIEFWILIIFAPFAFMSFAMPELKKMDYIGWDSWSSRLFSVAFMAPIFMFFMLIISKIIQIDIFKNIGNTFTQNKGLEAFAGLLLLTILPAIINISLLLKAVDYAKKGSGEFSKAVISGGATLAAAVGGLAVGVASGGTSVALRSTIGAAAMSTANNRELQDKAASGDRWAQRKLDFANSIASKSFDPRDTGLGKLLKSKGGLDFAKGGTILGLDSASLKGGYKAKEKRDAKKAQDRMKTHELSGANAKDQDNFASSEQGKAQNEIYKKYEENLENARKFVAGKGLEFDEKKFKADYENGVDLKEYGLNFKGLGKKLIKVETAEEVNKRRKAAYLNSLSNSIKDTDSGAIKVEKAMKNFWDNYKMGVGKTLTSPMGQIGTLAAGAVTGGVGMIVAPALGGFIHAFREGISVQNREFVAKVGGAKIESEKDEVLEHLGHILNPHDAAHPAAPAHPVPAAATHTTPTTSSAPAHDSHAAHH